MFQFLIHYIYASCGVAKSQRYIGQAYYHGLSINKNYRKAVMWLKRAARQGDLVAQNELGHCYSSGIGVEKNNNEAACWYSKAAEQGLKEAQYNIATCYHYGNGVVQSFDKAVKWYERAKKKGLDIVAEELELARRGLFVAYPGWRDITPKTGKSIITGIRKRPSPKLIKPLVSVVVTTYNHEQYLAEALNAIIRQRCDFGVEIILGEDCSSDNTLAVCQEYARRYPRQIRLIASTENVGWRANYRRCVEAARGKYVAFCDGDDYFLDREHLAMQVALMEQNPSAGLCYARAERRDENGDLTGYFPAREGHTTLDALLHDWCIENCTTLARRDAVLAYYDTEQPENHPEWLTEDLPMWLFVAAHSEVVYTNRVTAVHRVFADSVSHSTSLAKRLAFCDSSSNIKLWFDESYNHSRQRRHLLRERMLTALWVYSHIGSLGDYLRRWWSEIKASPMQLLRPAPYVLLVKKLFRKAK